MDIGETIRPILTLLFIPGLINTEQTNSDWI